MTMSKPTISRQVGVCASPEFMASFNPNDWDEVYALRNPSDTRLLRNRDSGDLVIADINDNLKPIALIDTSGSRSIIVTSGIAGLVMPVIGGNGSECYLISAPDALRISHDFDMPIDTGDDARPLFIGPASQVPFTTTWKIMKSFGTDGKVSVFRSDEGNYVQITSSLDDMCLGRIIYLLDAKKPIRCSSFNGESRWTVATTVAGSGVEVSLRITAAAALWISERFGVLINHFDLSGSVRVCGAADKGGNDAAQG